MRQISCFRGSLVLSLLFCAFAHIFRLFRLHLREEPVPKATRKWEQDFKIATTASNQLPPFRFILGVTTGHSGSTYAQKVLKNGVGCPFRVAGSFEQQAQDEQAWNIPKDGKSTWCTQHVQPKLLPFLESKRRGTRVYIDVGHFHNRGRTIECLAEALQQDVAFVRVRRNRYKIATSFIRTETKRGPLVTPCMRAHKVYPHPIHSTCPFDNAGDTNLMTDRETWKSLTPFQKFLWYADEMEHRWHTLQRDYPQATFFEITWEEPEELHDAAVRVRQQLGCDAGRKVALNKTHVSRHAKTVNCSHYVHEDLEYRKLMKFSPETMSILYGDHPQHLDFEECFDTRSQLESAIGTESSSGCILPE